MCDTWTRLGRSLFERALTEFLSHEGAFLVDNISERWACGRLSIYLERQLENSKLRDYYADVEYNRKQGDQVKTIINEHELVIPITPDIIVHTRGQRPPPRDNFIAIEAKKTQSPVHQKMADRARLRAMTSEPNTGVWGMDGVHPEHVCGYAVGVFLEIDRRHRKIRLEFFERGVPVGEKEMTF